MSDRDSLLAVGFTANNDGVLVALRDSAVRLIPTGAFFELRIGLSDGNAVCVVVPRVALKVCSERTTSPDIVDVDALISASSRTRRPW